ncbi:MAG: hypothetical protein Q8P92_02880 [Candidatus Daviesbacteria bacterium]|nr:hypothetical protein [Candidatus Daviesbacteria bacterium]
MKKLILPIPFFIVGLFLFLATSVFAQTINLGGTWTSEAGYSFKAEQSGDSISLIIEAGKNPKVIGTAGLTGTIKGNSFVGRVYETADDCPNLGTYIPATGIVSENTIELTYDAPKYYPDGCVYSGNYETVRNVLTRVSKEEIKPEVKQEDKDVGFDKEKPPSETEANAVNEWIKNNLGDLDIKRIEAGSQLERQPIITRKDQETVVETPAQDQFYLGMADTNGLVKLPDSGEFTDFQDIWHIPTGSTIRAIDKPIRINIGTKKVMIIAPGSEVMLTSDRQIDILKGTIEVNRVGIFSPDSEQQDTGASTEFIDLFVIGTHYWVTHEPGKQTLVGVYEGEVEVKTKDGKTIRVSPEAGKPGVVVITRKLSPVKLAVTGLILAVVVGGIVLILRKKLTSKVFNKRKK